jgi:hypothetical protein
MVKLADPDSSVATPAAEPPSLNTTLPAGVPTDEVTEAVKVTGWPMAEGSSDGLNESVAVGSFTTCFSIAEVPGEKSAFP